MASGNKQCIDAKPQSSKWNAVKKRLCQVFSPVAKKECMQPRKSILDSNLLMKLYRYITSDSLEWISGSYGFGNQCLVLLSFLLICLFQQLVILIYFVQLLLESLLYLCSNWEFLLSGG